MGYKYFLPLLINLVSLAMHAQNLTFSAESYITLNGERFSNKKIVFTKAEGDWFAKSDDAHGTVTLYTVLDSRPLRLDMEWDGKDELHTITNESRHGRKGEFMLTLPDKDVYGDGLNSTPDEVRIRVVKIDPLNVALKIDGSLAEDGKNIHVEGALQLKKTALKSMTSASYGNCDNTVYDKLTGAENRSPSACEVKFDMDVKTAFREAFEKAVDMLVEKKHFQVLNITELTPIDGVYRETEKYFSKLGDFVAELKIDPASEEGQAWYKRYNDAMEQLKTTAATPQVYENFTRFAYEVKTKTQIRIIVHINSETGGQGNYKGVQKSLQVPGVAFAVQGSYVSALTGGGEENSLDVTSLYIGKWKPGAIQKETDGGSTATTVGYFDKAASHLSVQNISIRLECSAELAQEIIKNIDIEKIKSLLH